MSPLSALSGLWESFPRRSRSQNVAIHAGCSCCRLGKVPITSEGITSRKVWSATYRGSRDGMLSKSEDICGRRPSSCVFWISQVLFSLDFPRCCSGLPEKGNKGRTRAKEKGWQRPISGKGGQTPPPFVTPPLAVAQKLKRSRF